jgi:hypothetical protein
MPVTNWNRTSPTSADNPANGANEISAVKKGVDERMRNGGHRWEPDSSATLTNAGRHTCGAEFSASGSGAQDDEFYIYDKAGTAVAVVRGSTSTNIDASGIPEFEIVGGKLIGRREETLHIPVASGTGRTAGIIYENRGHGTLTLLEAKVVCFTAPGSGGVDIDIHKQASGWTNPNDAGTSIFDPNPHPTIASGSYASSVISTFASSTLAVGDAWFVEVDQLNSAANVMLILKVWRK